MKEKLTRALDTTFRDQIYRPCVGIMLMNHEGKVLVGKRIDVISEAWQMPQGGIDQNEGPDKALWREMQEELGTVNAEIIAQSRSWFTYDFPSDLAPKLWQGQFAGQIQMWYLLKFNGDQQSIVLDRHKPEFSEVKWVAPSDILDMVIWFKKEIYKSILNEFGDLLSTIN